MSIDTFRTRSARESFLLIVRCAVEGGGDADGRRIVTVSTVHKMISDFNGREYFANLNNMGLSGACLYYSKLNYTFIWQYDWFKI